MQSKLPVKLQNNHSIPDKDKNWIRSAILCKTIGIQTGKQSKEQLKPVALTLSRPV